METQKNTDRLAYWQSKKAIAKDAWSAEREKMDFRERRYRGEAIIVDSEGNEVTKKGGRATHVRNVTMEIIETQVDTNIPMPKVSARRETGVQQAKTIESLCRQEINRIPIEEINDLQERVCPIQGADFVEVVWDNSQHTHTTVGELDLKSVHPKMLIPQPGVETELEDMDYFFIERAMTKGAVKRMWGKDVEDEGEEEPDVRSSGERSHAEDMVTVTTVYYKPEALPRHLQGKACTGRGRFVWCGETQLEDLDDYQVRRLPKCQVCGAIAPGDNCPMCGSDDIKEEVEEFMELTEDLVRSDGSVIPAMDYVRDELGAVVFSDRPAAQMAQDMNGVAGGLLMDSLFGGRPDPFLGVAAMDPEPVMRPTKIPYYKPGIYPVLMRRNISTFGKLMGESDVDAIEHQQNTLNQLGTKIKKKVLGGGSFVTMPADLKFEVTDQDMMVLRFSNIAQAEGIQVKNLQVDIGADLLLENQNYEQARQIIGITDSLQGRKDTTATSAVAKEFSAAQAAGRLNSKKVNKSSFFARLYEAMFKFYLAYCDGTRDVVSRSEKGEEIYQQFCPWDFLKQDAAGQWYWDTDYLFDADTSYSLAGNREAMWQENRANHTEGKYGDPSSLESLIIFWEVMSELHYPLAERALAMLKERQQKEKLAAAAAAQNPPMPTAPVVPGMEMGMEGGGLIGPPAEPSVAGLLG